jgi:ligand-binding SRPBCC domain-containing protein
MPLLASQRADPAALRDHGFDFEFATLEQALSDIVEGPRVSIRTLPGAAGDAAVPDSVYLRRWPPAYVLRTTTVLHATVEEAFKFFSKAENLGMLTPAAMRFSIHRRVPEIAEGTVIDYRLRVGPVPVTWRSRILDWQPGVRFVDSQERGPYRSWYHEHLFRREGATTVMEDRVYYAPPLNVIGRLVNRFFIVPALRRIFQYRAEVIRLRFGSG